MQNLLLKERGSADFHMESPIWCGLKEVISTCLRTGPRRYFILI